MCNFMFLLADTGGILFVDAESLETKAIGYEVEGIEQLKLSNDKFFSVNANKEAKLLEKSGQTIGKLNLS